ncbi:hypothetical protein [Novosphingobium pentaromativorans]|uniref:Multidrug resistance protein MdtA-like C-terminal permuted SH3 domain-containing protein n=1 Tax=Novosphingobium pentaromativorans US6-1 TaxID=1088721 RepID=G6EFR8_9SPHN|nr:hypothetical protein [Novosphingobium pentaromativorans]EHJ59846.1 hypothetical protein NSU_3189 [Novosphingobium pentaromativorans US6-1]
MKKGFVPALWALLGAAIMALMLLAGGVLHPVTGTAGGDSDDAASEAETAPEQDGIVHLDPGPLARAAIRSEPVASGSAPRLLEGFARVLDLSMLASIDADLTTARANLAASRAEAERLASLAAQDQSASRQAVEAARAKAGSDAAQVRLAERRFGLEFGPGLARMSAAARSALVADAGAGRAALLRISIPGRLPLPGTRVQVNDGLHTQTVRVMGPAASADPQLQNAAVLAVLSAPMAASAMAGRQFSASAAGEEKQDGVIVPRAALVRWQGQLWAYKETGKGTFRRIAIEEARPVGSGWLVRRGLTPGDRVVIDGATTLFAVERGSSAVQEDD